MYAGVEPGAAYIVRFLARRAPTLALYLHADHLCGDFRVSRKTLRELRKFSTGKRAGERGYTAICFLTIQVSQPAP